MQLKGSVLRGVHFIFFPTEKMVLRVERPRACESNMAERPKAGLLGDLSLNFVPLKGTCLKITGRKGLK